ncbi:uncharacterized protein K441DRAFT_710444, partial [Cenococcum geophilum 1.58]|uniref:uncharacterized protein n=1 Tax=Cenococcum geophilum 1.58 TaxID=794803 RepID=UPI00358F11E0
EEPFIQSFPLANWIKINNLLEKDEVRRYTRNVSLWDVLEKGNMSNLIKVHLTSLNIGADVDSTEAESILAGTTLVGTQDEHTFEPKQSSFLNVPDSDAFEDGDCMSIESNDEDIASQAATRRTEPEILAIRQFGSFFGELEELRPLHEEALKKLGTKRFQENYRRILKLYVLKLLNEAKTAVERDTVMVLKSRSNRLHIARRIVALMQEDEEDRSKPLDGLTAQPVEKQSLDDWARNEYASPDAEPEGYEQSSDESDGEDGEDNDENQDKYRLEELHFPNITQANRFLHRDIPFQTLVLELRLLVLPASLREVYRVHSEMFNSHFICE